jgi:pyruvate/2-oxoglutarate dehydrogenase complex dihydrolipoamide acyltransferase (E2) component
MVTEVKLAQFGMGMTEGTLVRWLKQVGDTVHAGEPLVEIEAAKAVEELLAPVSGVLTKVLVPEGEVAAVYSVIATID